MIKIPGAPYGVELYATIGECREERHRLLLGRQYNGPFDEEPGTVFIALENAAQLTEDALRELHEWASQNSSMYQLTILYAGRDEESIQSRKPPKKRVGKSGHVYVVQCGYYHKIGISSNVDRRVRQLKRKMPYDFELIHTIQTGDMIGLELSLHSHFAEKRIKSEWFKLDDSDVAFLKRIEYTKGALSEEDIAVIVQGGLVNG